MIHGWLSLPDPLVLLLLGLFYATTAGLIWGLTVSRHTRGVAAGFMGITPSFFSCVAVLFALMTGFLANDVATRTRQAGQALDAEAAAAVRVASLSMAAPADLAEMRGLLRAYVRSAIADDWPAMIGGGAAAATQAGLAALLQEAASPRMAAATGVVVQAALVEAVIAIETARAARHAAAVDATSELKWSTVLLLGVLVQVALAVVHLERPRAHAAAIVVFSAAAIIALGPLALQETPYSGWLEISPEPLKRVLAAIGPG